MATGPPGISRPDVPPPKSEPDYCYAEFEYVIHVWKFRFNNQHVWAKSLLKEKKPFVWKIRSKRRGQNWAKTHKIKRDTIFLTTIRLFNNNNLKILHFSHVNVPHMRNAKITNFVCRYYIMVARKFLSLWVFGWRKFCPRRSDPVY